MQTPTRTREPRSMAYWKAVSHRYRKPKRLSHLRLDSRSLRTTARNSPQLRSPTNTGHRSCSSLQTFGTSTEFVSRSLRCWFPRRVSSCRSIDRRLHEPSDGLKRLFPTAILWSIGKKQVDKKRSIKWTPGTTRRNSLPENSKSRLLSRFFLFGYLQSRTWEYSLSVCYLHIKMFDKLSLTSTVWLYRKHIKKRLRKKKGWKI